MTDLSKLPWDECELPRFKGRKALAEKDEFYNFVHIRAGATIVASNCQSEPFTNHWGIASAPLDEIELIIRMCRTVEAFIKEHGG